MPQLSDLSVELVHEVVAYLEFPRDINALSQTNRTFKSICSPLLYKRIKDRTAARPGPSSDSSSKQLDEGPLEWAAKHEKVACVSRLLYYGVQARPCSSILPPIIAAAKNGNIEIVELLLAYHPEMVDDVCHSWETGSFKGYHATALAYAIGYGHDSVVKFLIEKGASLFFYHRACPSHPSVNLLSPLRQAIEGSQGAFAFILGKMKRRSDCPPTDELILMAARTRFDIFKTIIDVSPGFFPGSGDNNGVWKKVLLEALRSQDVRIVEFLFREGVTPEMEPTEEWEPTISRMDKPANIFSAILDRSESHDEILTFLVRQINIDDVVGGSSLHALFCMMTAAATSGNEGLLCHLMKADLSQKKPTRIIKEEGLWETLVEKFCLSRAVQNGHTGILKAFLNHGVSLSYKKDKRPCSDLIEKAAKLGRYAALEVLLEMLEVEHTQDTQHEAKRHADSLWSYILSLALGASTSAKHLWDEPQEQLDQRQKIVKLMWEKTSGPLRTIYSEDEHLGICLNIRHEGIIQTLQECEFLRLGLREDLTMYWHQAIEKLNLTMMKWFLDTGYSACAKQPMAEQTRSPLNLLGNLGHSTCSLAEYTAAIELLLLHGANFDERFLPSGLTPLFILVSNEAPWNPISLAERVRAFLKQGADPFSSCDADKTLIETAVIQGDVAVVKVLLQFFDENDGPFDKVSAGVKRAMDSLATSGSLRMQALLSDWYWRAQKL